MAVSLPPAEYVAAAERSAVARCAAVPVPHALFTGVICHDGIANSALHPLVVTSWAAGFDCTFPKVPSFQTASSYVPVPTAPDFRKRSVPPTARMSGAEAG